jgi:hypothetical protein
MKSKEEILKGHYEAMAKEFPDQYKKWTDILTYEKPSIRYMIAAMDEYTDQLRTELEGMERLKDIYIEEAHEYNVLYDDAILEKEMLKSELAAVKMERDEALKKINEIANWPGMENII